MKRNVNLKVEDDIYQFYQKGAKILGSTPEELMEQALFRYAGLVAEALLQDDETELKS